jgi:D-aspartate ligase
MTLESHQTARVAEADNSVHGSATAAAPTASRKLPPAMVVGLCAHGLAVVRALASAGISVMALEIDADLPGARTAQAKVFRRGPMNGPGVAQTLVQLAVESKWPARPVLFLMNDNMVRDVAENWSMLAPYYQLSWRGCTASVLRLMSKDNLPEICAASGVRFPVTARYSGDPQELAALAQVPYPAIVKPAWPLGSFKARIVNSRAEIEALAQEHLQSLPFVVQQWIPGGPTALCFATLYLRQGRVLARLEGRKMYAGPDGMGQGTVMAPEPNDDVHQAAMKFLAGLRLSGPVAVEFKTDPNGVHWLIEPNVGRTEYCVDLCTVNGINLPVIEYRDALDLEPIPATQRNARIWFDTDRDGASWLRFLRMHGLDGRALRPAFPYLLLRDLGPFWHATKRRVGRWLGRR